MDKKVSIKNIDKIVKFNKYESKTVTYVCGDENIDITINPCVDYADWFSAIEEAMGIIFWDDGTYKPALSSSAYDYALVSCFTNIKTDNVNKIIELTKCTDIAEKIRNALPALIDLKFANDFEDAKKSREQLNSPVGKILLAIEGFSKYINSLSEEDIAGLINDEDKESKLAE